jgi:hypothetical protein
MTGALSKLVAGDWGYSHDEIPDLKGKVRTTASRIAMQADSCFADRDGHGRFRRNRIRHCTRAGETQVIHLAPLNATHT